MDLTRPNSLNHHIPFPASPFDEPSIRWHSPQFPQSLQLAYPVRQRPFDLGGVVVLTDPNPAKCEILQVENHFVAAIESLVEQSIEPLRNGVRQPAVKVPIQPLHIARLETAEQDVIPDKLRSGHR